MQYKVLLDTKTNLREVEVEEQTKFVISIIDALEIPFEWDSNKAFTILDKVRLRKMLNQYNISIMDDMGGGLKIYLENDKVAEWKKPSYILKEDLSQIDPKNRLFIEMTCDFSSIFDEEQPP